jgi:excinuclease UvrABC nuclease subunit
MNGPYLFTNEDIDQHVPDGTIGAYILSSGNNVASYVGRSDSNLRQRLKQRILESRNEGKNYIHFWFQTADSSLQAYYLECKWYHEYRPGDNQNHPAIPPGAAWKCPIPGCPWSV